MKHFSENITALLIGGIIAIGGFWVYNTTSNLSANILDASWAAVAGDVVVATRSSQILLSTNRSFANGSTISLHVFFDSWKVWLLPEQATTSGSSTYSWNATGHITLMIYYASGIQAGETLITVPFSGMGDLVNISDVQLIGSGQVQRLSVSNDI